MRSLMKIQIRLFLLFLVILNSSDSQGAIHVNDTLHLEHIEGKQTSKTFQKGDYIKIKTKDKKRLKGEITKITKNEIRLLQKGQSSTIKVEDIEQIQIFSWEDLYIWVLVFLLGSLIIAGNYTIILIAMIATIFLVFVFAEAGLMFLIEPWFIGLVGGVGGMLTVALISLITKINPFKRYRIGKKWRLKIK